MITVALIGWPILTIIMARNVPWPNAVAASLIGGYLLLPGWGGLDLPLLPPLEKDTIPCMMLFALALVLKPGEQPKWAQAQAQTPRAQPGWVPKSMIGKILLGVMIFGALMTAATNSDPIRFTDSASVIPPLKIYDGFSIIVRSSSIILPVLLGRKYLADPYGHRVLLWIIVIAGLGYSFLALAEVRLSPQLNRWVYGFFAHSWHQHLRGGGYRPLVFLDHGLLLAIFFSMTIIAAFGLSRADHLNRMRWLLAGGWLLATLILCNSLGALVIAVALLPVVLMFSVSLQLWVAGGIAILVLFYPLLRGAGWIPTQWLVEIATSYDLGRGLSLNFRFENEDALLLKANERPLFGWGGWGRNRIYDTFGRDLSVVDGAWIAIIGQGGWLRYLAEFGLLSFPLMLLAARQKRLAIEPATAALCLVLAANMVDMLPNAGRSPITWLIVGALLGRLELGKVTEKIQGNQTGVDRIGPSLTVARNPVSAYTRQSTQHQRVQSAWKP